MTRREEIMLDELFKYNNFVDKTIETEWCATTREIDRARIRLIVHVNPCVGGLRFDVFADGILMGAYETFRDSLDRFNYLRNRTDPK